MTRFFQRIPLSSTTGCRLAAWIPVVLMVLMSSGPAMSRIDDLGSRAAASHDAADTERVVRTAQVPAGSGLQGYDLRVVLERLPERDGSRDGGAGTAGQRAASAATSWASAPAETPSVWSPTFQSLFIIHGALLM